MKTFFKLACRNRAGWMLVLLGLLLSLWSSAYAFADTLGDGDAMSQANALYDKGDYAAASAGYEQLAQQHVTDSALFYNLGNAYYQQGELGQAMLNYSRAAQLAPRDEDIRANLALARSQVLDKYDADSQDTLGELLDWVQGVLTRNELATLALGLWTLCCGLGLIYGHVRSGSGRGALQAGLLGAVVLLLGSIVFLTAIFYNQQTQPPAIVLAKEIRVLSGPGGQYNTEFTLHQGAQVSLLETRDAWVRIALPGGQAQGWAPIDTVAAIR